MKTKLLALCLTLCVLMAAPVHADFYYDRSGGVFMFDDGQIYELYDFNTYATAGTYTFDCDYAIVASNGKTYYMPTTFVTQGFDIVVYKAQNKDNNIKLIASNGDELPYVGNDTSRYWQSFINYGKNTDTVDVYTMKLASYAGQATVTLTEDTITGEAIGTDATQCSSYIIWSNYDVLDQDGALVHESDVEGGSDPEPEPEPEPDPECICTDLCTEDAVNEDCEVCSADLSGCLGTAPEEPPVEPDPECICTDLCTEDAINEDCEVCSADLSGCLGEEPVVDPEVPEGTVTADMTETNTILMAMLFTLSVFGSVRLWRFLIGG